MPADDFRIFSDLAAYAALTLHGASKTTPTTRIVTRRQEPSRAPTFGKAEVAEAIDAAGAVRALARLSSEPPARTIGMASGNGRSHCS
jgi:hypothetical protein